MGQVQHAGTELVLVRHGEGECNAAGVIGGEAGCSGLSGQGVEQSRRLTLRLAREHNRRPFPAVHCSPRLRVRQSATLIGEALGVPVVVVDGVRGQDFGTADGRSWLQVTADFGGPPIRDPDRPIADGAEAWNTYAERVLRTLTRLLTRQAGRPVLLIGHGKTVGLAGALLSGAADPASSAGSFVIDHGALTHWRWTDGAPASGWTLVVHNDTAHLAAGAAPVSALPPTGRGAPRRVHDQRTRA
jgi:probable phosphoglycerate mutase